jgi:hypothetical protein
MPRPEGYRKALRLMKMAERFGRPVLAFIDTPGAYPGIDAEERGQAEAIAVCLEEMAGLRVPVISVVIGEGGSGGALAIGVCNRLLMLQYSWYSVIPPGVLRGDPSPRQLEGGEKAAESASSPPVGRVRSRSSTSWCGRPRGRALTRTIPPRTCRAAQAPCARCASSGPARWWTTAAKFRKLGPVAQPGSNGA